MIDIDSKTLKEYIQNGTARTIMDGGNFATFWIWKHIVQATKDSFGNWMVGSIEETDTPDPLDPPPDKATLAARELITRIQAHSVFDWQLIEKEIAELLRNWSR